MMFSRFFALGAFLATVAANKQPLALPLVHVLSRGSQVEIALKGYDPDASRTHFRLTASLSSGVSNGKIYQLATNYINQDLLPKTRSSDIILRYSDAIKDKRNRIIYESPNKLEPEEMWDSFRYTVKDEGGLTSAQALVYIVPPSMIIQSSTFRVDSDHWTVSGDRASSSVFHESFSRGKLNQYIYFSDLTVDIDENENDLQRWRFVAPKKFSQDFIGAYGGAIHFDLAAFAGNFSASNLHPNTPLVRLECSSCAMHQGITLELRLGGAYTFNGAEKSFNIPLLANAGWVKDPKNSLLAWAAPSDCEMLEVVQGISGISLAGDFTRWTETVALDNFKILASSKYKAPKKCLCTSPGSHC